MPVALHQEILRPSGVEFAVSLKLVNPRTATPSNVQVLGNLVVARSSNLKVFEVRSQNTSPKHNVEDQGSNGIDVENVEMDGELGSTVRIQVKEWPCIVVRIL
jgi:cleavage and polyadenylation specificity factor subunit 1